MLRKIIKIFSKINIQNKKRFDVCYLKLKLKLLINIPIIFLIILKIKMSVKYILFIF